MKIALLRKYRFEANLALHTLLGAICSVQPNLVFFWVFYIIFYEGTIQVFRSRNAYGQAHLAAAYMAAFEMIVRMSRIGLPHELAKYAVVFILINGLLAKPRFSSRSALFFIFFALLTPSVLLLIDAEGLEKARQAVSFNLMGPLCLAVAGVYFYRRPIYKEELARIFQRFLLPIAATVTWLFINTPRASELEFGFGANFAASGYGPNQMASVLGFGILIIGLSFLFKISIFRSNMVGFLLLALIAYRALLTFSRGGLAIPMIILAGLVFYFFFTQQRFRAQFGRIAVVTILFSVVSYGIFQYVNEQTGNALYNRYAGISYGKQVGVKKYTSGRLDILKIDGQIFSDYPFFGIGPGMGNEMRVEYGYHERAAAHIEFSRLLAEHGLFGVIALCILLGFPWWEFRQRRGIEQRFLLIAGVLFCLGFMAHSATRIALPMFLYGLGFALILSDRNNGTLPRQYAFPARRLRVGDRDIGAPAGGTLPA